MDSFRSERRKIASKCVSKRKTYLKKLANLHKKTINLEVYLLYLTFMILVNNTKYQILIEIFCFFRDKFKNTST